MNPCLTPMNTRTMAKIFKHWILELWRCNVHVFSFSSCITDYSSFDQSLKKIKDKGNWVGWSTVVITVHLQSGTNEHWDHGQVLKEEETVLLSFEDVGPIKLNILTISLNVFSCQTADKYGLTIVILGLRNYVSLFRCCYKHFLVINLEYCGMALRWTRRETRLLRIRFKANHSLFCFVLSLCMSHLGLYLNI